MGETAAGLAPEEAAPVGRQTTMRAFVGLVAAAHTARAATVAAVEPTRILVAWHTETNRTGTLGAMIAAAADAIEDTRVRAMPVGDVSCDDMEWAHGVALGSPVYWGPPAERTWRCSRLQEDDAGLPTPQKLAETAFASPSAARGRGSPRPPRGHSVETSRGGAAAATWIVRGDDAAAENDSAGMYSGAFKSFLDDVQTRCFGWPVTELRWKAGAAFTTGGHAASGKEATLAAIRAVTKLHGAFKMQLSVERVCF